MNRPDQWQEIQQLPIFPLPAVLLPGMLMPLQIFEPRYRQMLRNCLEGPRCFGLTYHPQSAVGTLVVPEAGSVGCLARITAVAAVPDGRSNIMTVGDCRYETFEYLSQDPYLIAKVDFIVDDEEQIELYQDLIEDVSDLFLRFIDALRTLRDEPRSLFRLPQDPELSSFAIASVVFTQPEEHMEVLHMRSTRERFQHLKHYLDEIVDDLQARAEDHLASRSNGHRDIGILRNEERTN